jgi:hypothetical protein
MDQILRRVLDYLGLRGVVQHEYEQTVVPTLMIGDLSQTVLVREALNIPVGNAIFTVPAGETWEIVALGGISNQTIGAVAFRWSLTWNDVNTGRNFLVPFWQEVDNTGEVLSITHTLNTNKRWSARPIKQMLVAEGYQLQQVGLAGDGTRTMANGWVMYRKFGERLVENL